MIFLLIIRCVLYFTEENTNEFKAMSDFVISYLTFILLIIINKKLVIAKRIFFVIQLLFISLKIDGVIEWSWKLTFLPYWICFSLLVALNLCMSLMVFSKIFQPSNENVEGFNLINNFYVLNE